MAKRSIEEFLIRHRFIVAYAIILLSSLTLIPVFKAEIQGDVGLYHRIADDLLIGKLPYRDRVVEYPPYSIPIFLLPSHLDGANEYQTGFMMLAFVVDFSLKFLLLAAAFQHMRGWRSLLPVLCYCAAVPFIRYFYLQRYDVWPTLVCFIAILLFFFKRYVYSGLVIAAGIGIKLYPAVFVPPLFILAVRQKKGARFAFGVATGLLPIALLGFVLPWWRFAQFHGARGLQAESLYASILWLGKLLGLAQVSWAHVNVWCEVAGPSASTVLPWARILFAGSVIISTGLVSWFAARLETPSIAQLARLLLVPLLAFVAFNQVLSPQYMIWLLPLAALGALEKNPWPLLAISFATMLTPVSYPSVNYSYGLELFQTIVLLSRNLILIVVWILLIHGLINDYRLTRQKCQVAS